MCSVDRGLEDALAVLEGRARVVDDVLLELGVGISALTQARSDVEWSGQAATQFSGWADELAGVLQAAASALDESLRSARGAASAAAAGSVG